ncbi:excinuclease ABC subunit B [Candidatus Phytoplasma oryzae]|uniref:UvrABC system protein B n=1 Tax=Candidatus Phytoplasma oryzae TaxID=203274 RepID=A0A139JR41_9MOLU|nr:excinuclease ABC subunit UvrB [Candidatus Phytoplasma oryzae]KXT29250.1 excinuclease ABC subunit B [Candidatus Phytoplasma oryzae]KXT29346.1 excinuclease ABC subunit B [Candidatus Phytoplasma oryzae]RAM57900.1 excinuclease ABC subunit B [Candidatus Phytoplasma oryzae]
MDKFKLKKIFLPSGDQPQAIKKLLFNFKNGIKEQIILGATGTGKTFTIANIIAKLNKNTLIIVHNKTLAGQIYNELKEMFPVNKVSYFISYFDYYQPEAYIASHDTYIEKDSSINEKIDQLRHHAVNSLAENNKKVIIVSSVSCIYGIGDISNYKKSLIFLKVGRRYCLKDLINQLIEMQYQRNNIELKRGNFRIRGDILEIVLSSQNKKGIRIIFFDNEIEEIKIFDLITNFILESCPSVTIFPSSLYVADKDKLTKSIKKIKQELKEHILYFEEKKQFLEIQRIKMRTNYDLEMLQELGYCNGIENYSRHLALKKENECPTTLIDYFNKDFLTIIDESHVTIPQIKGMYLGDRSRKKNLVKYGFRLPSSLDNRPLKLEEFEKKIDKLIYLSATPGQYELNKKIPIIEQIIRPTYLLDPIIEIRSTKNQIENLYFEIKKTIKKKERILITTITINMSEDLTNHFKELGIKTAFLHSEIQSLERLKILKQLRLGIYDCLIGVNLLREGLDLPEVSLVVILDADKQGFLRNESSLIQTIGRAARNINGKVIMYADKITYAMNAAIQETNRRRKIQIEYNKKNNVFPTPLKKKIKKENDIIIDKNKTLSKKNNNQKIYDINKIHKLMKKSAKELNFEKAIFYRNLIEKLKKTQ